MIELPSAASRVVSQAVNSLSNAAFVVLYAQVASVEEFARFSVGYTAILSFVGLHRTLVGDELQLSLETGFRRLSSTAFLATPAVTLSLLVGILLFLLGCGPETVLWMSLGAAVVLINEAARVTLLVSGNAMRAVLGDLLWLAGLIAGWGLLGGSDASLVLLGGWVAGAVISCALLLSSLAGALIVEAGWGDLLERRWPSVVNFGSLALGAVVSMAILHARDEGLAASVRAATTLVAPVGTLAAGLRLTFLRRFAVGATDMRSDSIVYGGLIVVAVVANVSLIFVLVRGVGADVTVDAIRLGYPHLGAVGVLLVVQAFARPVLDLALTSTRSAARLATARVTSEAVALPVVALWPGLTVGWYFLLRAATVAGVALRVTASSRKDPRRSSGG